MVLGLAVPDAYMLGVVRIVPHYGVPRLEWVALHVLPPTPNLPRLVLDFYQ